MIDLRGKLKKAYLRVFDREKERERERERGAERFIFFLTFARTIFRVGPKTLQFWKNKQSFFFRKIIIKRENFFFFFFFLTLDNINDTRFSYKKLLRDQDKSSTEKKKELQQCNPSFIKKQPL